MLRCTELILINNVCMHYVMLIPNGNAKLFMVETCFVIILRSKIVGMLREKKAGPNTQDICNSWSTNKLLLFFNINWFSF